MSIKIICNVIDYNTIGDTWCCDINKKNNNECLENCLKCFEEHGINFEIK